MRLRTLEDARQLAESIRAWDDPQYGPMRMNIDHVEDEIRIRLARGDFADVRTRVLVRLWLLGAARRRKKIHALKPEALALRSTLAAERAARYALLAVVVSVGALLVAAWPYLTR